MMGPGESSPELMEKASRISTITVRNGRNRFFAVARTPPSDDVLDGDVIPLAAAFIPGATAMLAKPIDLMRVRR